MEDLTLALITLTSFVLLFVVAIFADRAGAGADADDAVTAEAVLVPVDDLAMAQHRVVRPQVDADVA